MTATDALGHIAAGLRLDLILLAVMVILTGGDWKPDAVTPARRLKARRLNLIAWTLMAIAVLTYSPAHAAWLLGHPTPHMVSRSLDVAGSALACAAFIKLLAARGLMRGLTWGRVVRGIIVNNLLILAVVGFTWRSH